MNTFISKIFKANSSDFCVIQSTRDVNDFSFKILEYSNDTNNVVGEWVGNLPIEELKNSATELGMTYESFLNEFELIFIVNDISTTRLFFYSIEGNTFRLHKNEKFKCLYAEINIQPVKNLRDNFLLDCVNLIDYKNNNLKEYELKVATLNVEHQTIVQSFQKCVAQKTETEKNLLSKFAILLNSKKDKIAELQELLLEKRKTSTERNALEDDDYDDDDDNIDSVYSQPTQKEQKMGSSVKLPKRVTHPSTCNVTIDKSENAVFENDTQEILDL